MPPTPRLLHTLTRSPRTSRPLVRIPRPYRTLHTSPARTASERARYGGANEPKTSSSDPESTPSREPAVSSAPTPPEKPLETLLAGEIFEGGADEAATGPEPNTPKTNTPSLDTRETKPPSPDPEPTSPEPTSPTTDLFSRPGTRPLHLQPGPYVHHFDSYGLVKGLEGGGWGTGVAVDLMKAVRGLLGENMEIARRGLVGRGDVENESYLFSAACAELRTEIQNKRKAEVEKLRTQRAQLQHEVDILNQKVAQELLNLKDELKGMFDDRKMAVRMEQRNMESLIQELNYKITVALNSDARSDVEGLRWVLTRRAASALAIGVVMILATLQYSRYMTQTQAKERSKFAEEAGGNGNGNGNGNGRGDGFEASLARDGVS